MALEPLELLLAFDQIVIPVAIAVPPILAFAKPVAGNRDTVAICWYLPIALMGLTVLEIAAVHLAQPHPPLLSTLNTCALLVGSVPVGLAFLSTGGALLDRHRENEYEQQRGSTDASEQGNDDHPSATANEEQDDEDERHPTDDDPDD